jgi:hypothetical protein
MEKSYDSNSLGRKRPRTVIRPNYGPGVWLSQEDSEKLLAFEAQRVLISDMKPRSCF